MAVSGPYRSSFDEILILDLYNLVLYKLNCIRKYLNKIKKNIVYIQKKQVVYVKVSYMFKHIEKIVMLIMW